MTTPKSISQAVVLCGAFFVTSMVWSDDCPEAEKATNASNPDAAQAQTKALSASDSYKLFHDATLNELDVLGDYVQNFHANR